jgi:hypothetical protein
LPPHLGPRIFEIGSQEHEDLGSHPLLLAQQPEKQVLGADVVVVEAAGLLGRELDGLHSPGGARQVAHDHLVGTGPDDALDFEADLAEVNAQVLQHVGGDPGPLLDQPEQDVLGADVPVTEPLRLPLGLIEDVYGPLGVRVSAGHAQSSERAPPNRTAELVIMRTGAAR